MDGPKNQGNVDIWAEIPLDKHQKLQQLAFPIMESSFGLPKGKARDRGMNEEPGSMDIPY